MQLDKNTMKRTVIVLGLGLLAGPLSLAGCSDPMKSSAYGSGDKRDDPALKASMKGAMEAFKAKSVGVKNVHPRSGKGPG